MKRKTSNLIAFDIGSSKISAAAATIDNGVVSVSAQTIHASEGIKSGMIINMELAETSIVGAIYGLEKNCDKSIKQAAISLSGANVKSYYIAQKIRISGNIVTNLDVKRLITKALAEFKTIGKEIIHYFPVEFRLGNNQIVDNPLELHATEISCQLHIIAADSSMIMNLVRCFGKHQVEVNEIILGIYASALAVLTEDEMELGTTIIDMGANTTSYAIILKGKLLYTNSVPVGGHDITLTIAKKLSISPKEAEKLKILYGNAVPKMLLKDAIIELPNQNRSVTSAQISSIIAPIIEDIFKTIKKQITDISLDHLAANQVVITGGAAALPGIKISANTIFQKQIRIAKYESMPGFVESYNPLSHSTLIGMVKLKTSSLLTKYGKDYIDNSSWFRKMFLWIKNNI